MLGEEVARGKMTLFTLVALWIFLRNLLRIFLYDIKYFEIEIFFLFQTLMELLKLTSFSGWQWESSTFMLMNLNFNYL